MLQIDNYSILRSDRSHSPGGGVALFYRNDLNIKWIDVDCSKFNSVISNFEFLCIDLFHNSLQTRFLCLYLPPKFSICPNTVKTVCKLIDNLSSMLFPCFVIGDFNLPKIDWESYSSNGSISHDIFLQFCVNNGWTQHIQSSTHIKHNTLDLLLSNFLGNKTLQSFSVNPPLTTKCDHNLIALKLLNKIYSKSPPTPLLNYNRTNFQMVLKDLSSVIWNLPTFYNNLYDRNDLQSLYDYFINTINQAVNKHTPLRNSRPRSFKPPKHIKKMLKQKLTLYKKYKTDKTLKSKYKQISIDYENSVKQWRDGIEQKICQNPSSRKFYSFVNKKLKCMSSIPPLLSSEKVLCFSDVEKANIFNHNFQKVFILDDGKLFDKPQLSFNQMGDFEITPEDIMSAIFKMKSKLTRSPEGIPSLVLKQISCAILSPLTFLFNSFLLNHYAPHQWKTSFIVPIYKKGDKSNPLNYRPISLTSTFSRLFESVLHSKISDFLHQFSLISPYQYGFLKNRSSCEQLLTCIYNWLCNICYNNSNVHIVYTDIAKAFDTVSHSKLVHTLKSYGINSHIILWVKDFLTKRVQSVCIGSSMSTTLPVHSGVPQGSVLGPLLFLLYIDDITSSVDSAVGSSEIRLFADDAKLFSTDQANLQHSLDNFVSWLDAHQLNIAANKCNSICLPKPKAPIDPPTFTIKNQTLDYNPLIKDLGVYISDDLKWGTHINKIVKKALLKSYQILKFFKSRNIWTLKRLFCTYVRPQLEYNTPVWSPYLLKNKTLLESVQKRYTKVIFYRCSIPFSSYEDRLHKINLDSLERRRLNYDLILLYKIVYGLSCIKFSDYFQYINVNYNLRRNSIQIMSTYQLKRNNKLWSNNFFNRVPVIWNELPNEIVVSPSLDIFKSKLKKHKIVNRLTFV